MLKIVFLLFLPCLCIGQTADEYYKKGSDAQKKNNFQLALFYLNQAIQLEPNNCRYYISRSLWKLGGIEDLSKDSSLLRKSLIDIDFAIDKGCIESSDFSLKAFILHKMNLQKLAVDNYQKALLMLNDTTSFETFNQRASIKDILEDYNGAIKDYTKAISIDPKKGEMLFSSRGFAKSKINDLQGALSDYTKQIELNNYSSGTMAEMYFTRGCIKRRLNNKKGACEDWSKAGELGYMSAYNYIKSECNY